MNWHLKKDGGQQTVEFDDQLPRGWSRFMLQSLEALLGFYIAIKKFELFGGPLGNLRGVSSRCMETSGT